MVDTSELDKVVIGRVDPYIYAFVTNTVPNYLKVGDTYRPVEERLNEWRNKGFKNLQKTFEHIAKVSNDIYFRDFAVHQFLENDKGLQRLKPNDIPGIPYYSREFFKGAQNTDVKSAIKDIRKAYKRNSSKYNFYSVNGMASRLPLTYHFSRTEAYPMRPNQKKTVKAFEKAVSLGRSKLLMYAVMRFGKSFTTMQCALKMKAKFVLVVSGKADVRDEWKRTVESHKDFDKYEFVHSGDLVIDSRFISKKISAGKRVVVFLTLQDLMGNKIKKKHTEIFATSIDLLVVDETHFAARADVMGAVLKGSSETCISADEKDSVADVEKYFKEKNLNAKVTLHLSGTPYRILMGTEFAKEDIIASYQFSDIVKDQETWKKNKENIDKDEWDNPYYGFPQMIRFAFNLNESSRALVDDLHARGISTTFSALFKPKSVTKTDDGQHLLFEHETEVNELLQVIDGKKQDSSVFGFLNYPKIKRGNMCRHIVCVLPYCASCDAMEALIKKNKSQFRNLGDYEVLNISGLETKFQDTEDIKRKIEEYEQQGKQTLTLTVNRMLTGTTVKEWDTMLYLKDTSSPEAYDQAVFRLQNQYIREYKGNDGTTIRYDMKPQTLLVDFCPERMMSLQERRAFVCNILDGNIDNTRVKRSIEEEIQISPIFSLNADKMVEVKAKDIMLAVSKYSANRGVAEEVNEIPVDLNLQSVSEIWDVVKQENELNSKAGIRDLSYESDEESDLTLPNDDAVNPNPSENSEDNEDSSEDTNELDPVKQFRAFYARLLFYAFLTNTPTMSLKDIISNMGTGDNVRISKHLGLRKDVLQAFYDNMNPIMLHQMDYKIQNLNELSRDENITAQEKANVVVRKFNKLGESEVVTPIRIATKMVELLPEPSIKKAFKKKEKFLDIASKTGEFTVALYNRLIEHRRLSSIKSSIYAVPTSSITYELTRKVYELLELDVSCIAEKFTAYDLLKVKKGKKIDYDKISDLLSQEKPFSEIDLGDVIQEGSKKVKFATVVGNPPYQLAGGSGGNSDASLYQYFAEIANTLDTDLVCMITPARWFSAGRENLIGAFRKEMLTGGHIEKMFVYPDSHDVFEGVELKGGSCYYLRNSSYSGDCDYRIIENGVEQQYDRDLAEFPLLIRDPILNEVVKKVVKQNGENKWVSQIISSDTPFGIPSNPRTSKKTPFDVYVDSTNTHNTLLYHIENSKRKVEYVAKDSITKHSEDIDRPKVFIPGGYGAGEGWPHQIIGVPELASSNSVCSQSYLYAAFNSDDEANNFCKYLHTKFLRALVASIKITQGASNGFYKFVPILDFTFNSEIDWSKSVEEIDKQLYKKYGLTESEIQYIESKIKPMAI